MSIGLHTLLYPPPPPQDYARTSYNLTLRTQLGRSDSRSARTYIYYHDHHRF